MNLIINLHERKLMRMEANKMKKIFFFKLWEYNIYYKFSSLHLQNKMFGRVYMNQEWAIMKKTFKDWKALSVSTPQEKDWSFLVNWIKKATIE